MQSFFKPFLGLFEMALFMREGLKRFGNGKADLIKSFGIAYLTWPFIYASTPYLHDGLDKLENATLEQVQFLYMAKFPISIALVIGFMYIVCHVLERKDKFIKLITVSNWATLIPLLLFLPFFFMMRSGAEYTVIYPYIVLISVYSYALGAFITKHVLAIPWELAIFFTICTLAIHESCFRVLYFLAQ